MAFHSLMATQGPGKWLQIEEGNSRPLKVCASEIEKQDGEMQPEIWGLRRATKGSHSHGMSISC